jgi:hypothetical protein
VSDIRRAVSTILRDQVLFSEQAGGLKLRRYQAEAARAILASVQKKLGHTLVIQFPRQSGKNELQAQLEAYLLAVFSLRPVEIIKVSPTWKPQTLNAMRRLERVLESNLLTSRRWAKESGYIYRVNQARIFFLSGSPTANVVGATASLLLECDEAQDVLASKWDKDFSPMASSTNATRVLWGTAWTSRTLLARELRAAREAETADGCRRVFTITADQVSEEVPAYGDFVRQQVARMGREHPLVKTQFYGEEIDALGGMFPAHRRALMQGDHPPRLEPEPGRLYALLVDVAGEDENAGEGLQLSFLANPTRDATALTVIEIDRTTVRDELLRAPTYRVVHRRQWLGARHSSLYGQIRALAEHWRARRVLVDATGVGAGLASFLAKALPGKVTAFLFSQASKSKLGWDFLAVVDSGRYKEYAPADRDQDLFFRQCEFCRYEVGEGPGKVLRWGVPDGQRDPARGELLHDDLLLSAALCAALDGEDWAVGEARSLVIPPVDPLAGLGW